MNATFLQAKNVFVGGVQKLRTSKAKVRMIQPPGIQPLQPCTNVNDFWTTLSQENNNVSSLQYGPTTYSIENYLVAEADI